jgi:hypothetical protein
MPGNPWSRESTADITNYTNGPGFRLLHAYLPCYFSSSPALCGRSNFITTQRKMDCPDKPGNDEWGGRTVRKWVETRRSWYYTTSLEFQRTPDDFSAPLVTARLVGTIVKTNASMREMRIAFTGLDRHRDVIDGDGAGKERRARTIGIIGVVKIDLEALGRI